MEIEVGKIRERLMNMAMIYLRIAEGAEEIHDPDTGERNREESKISCAAAAMMGRMEPTEPEIEGDQHTWFYVCGECHTPVDTIDRFCRQCGRPLKWERMTSGKAQD